LVIDAGEQPIAGASAPLKRLQGSFMDTPVVRAIFRLIAKAG
jgi:hypothetical protein